MGRPRCFTQCPGKSQPEGPTEQPQSRCRSQADDAGAPTIRLTHPLNSQFLRSCSSSPVDHSGDPVSASMPAIWVKNAQSKTAARLFPSLPSFACNPLAGDEVPESSPLEAVDKICLEDAHAITEDDRPPVASENETDDAENEGSQPEMAPISHLVERVPDITPKILLDDAPVTTAAELSRYFSAAFRESGATSLSVFSPRDPSTLIRLVQESGDAATTADQPSIALDDEMDDDENEKPEPEPSNALISQSINRFPRVPDATSPIASESEPDDVQEKGPHLETLPMINQSVDRIPDTHPPAPQPAPTLHHAHAPKYQQALPPPATPFSVPRFIGPRAHLSASNPPHTSPHFLPSKRQKRKTPKGFKQLKYATPDRPIYSIGLDDGFSDLEALPTGLVRVGGKRKRCLLPAGPMGRLDLTQGSNTPSQPEKKKRRLLVRVVGKVDKRSTIHQTKMNEMQDDDAFSPAPLPIRPRTVKSVAEKAIDDREVSELSQRTGRVSPDLGELAGVVYGTPARPDEGTLNGDTLWSGMQNGEDMEPYELPQTQVVPETQYGLSRKA